MILQAFLEKRASISHSGGHPSNSLSWMGGGDSFSGVNVTEYNALNFTAVYAAVRVLAESVASVPLKMYRKRSDGGRDEADGERAYWLVHDEPNKDTTSFIWRETLQGHLCTWGNAYSVIDTVNGQPDALWQRRPDYAEVDRNDSGEIVYTFERTEGPKEGPLPADRVFHVPGLSFNGFVGFSPVRQARESIGLGVALERYGAALFGNRSTPSGFIRHPDELNEEAHDHIRKQIEEMHKGAGNAHRVAVIDEGMEWQMAGLPNDDAQFLETRRFQVDEIARWFRIPPHMLADLERATFSNIEEMSLEFVKYTMLPWFRRWESECNRKLLTRQQKQQGYYFEFNADGLLRGDFESRMNGYSSGRQWGWLSVNDIRTKENMNPVEGGDEYLQPLNMGPLGEEPDPVGGRSVPESRKVSESRAAIENRSLDTRWRIQEAFRTLLEQHAERLVAAEVKAIRKAVESIPSKGTAAFRLWLEEFFRKHKEFAEQVMGPTIAALLEAVAREALAEVDGDEADLVEDLHTFIGEYTDAFGKRHVGSGFGQLSKLLEDAETDEQAVDAILERIAEWDEKSAGKIGLRESVQAMNAGAMVAYAAAGVTLWRWVWNGGDCGICPNMNGKVVELGRPFVTKGDRVGDDDETVSTLVVKKVRNHPPLHRGCQCSVSPEFE